MTDIKQMKLIRATQGVKGLVQLYKTPNKPSSHGLYSIETLDIEGNPVESRSFRNIRRKLDAEAFFEYALRMG